MKNLDIKVLRNFCYVVELNTFEAAAKKVRVTQSAISQQIGNLENKLNIELFSKEGRNKILTPNGEKFYKRAKRLIELNDSTVLYVKRIAKK